MRVAYLLARGTIPDHTSKFSRKDFTLPQLFACLIVKEQQKKTYREAEDLLRDAEHWCRDIGMKRAPAIPIMRAPTDHHRDGRFFSEE
jgi:hypothetical protein